MLTDEQRKFISELDDLHLLLGEAYKKDGKSCWRQAQEALDRQPHDLELHDILSSLELYGERHQMKGVSIQARKCGLMLLDYI